MTTLTDETVEGEPMTEERGAAYRPWLGERTVAVVGLARSGVAAARLVRRLGGARVAVGRGARARGPGLRALRGRPSRGGLCRRRSRRGEPRRAARHRS